MCGHATHARMPVVGAPVEPPLFSLSFVAFSSRSCIPILYKCITSFSRYECLINPSTCTKNNSRTNTSADPITSGVSHETATFHFFVNQSLKQVQLHYYSTFFVCLLFIIKHPIFFFFELTCLFQCFLLS